MSATSPWWFFDLAGKAATKQQDLRTHNIGAVGVRSDGVMVVAYNGAAQNRLPAIHAEARLCKKMDYYGTVYVARLTSTGYHLARPCRHCQRVLRSRKVKRVYYTISNTEYGVMDLS